MYFQDIEINSFRGINKLKIDDFQLINLFVGQNNACKTSILEALFLLLGVSNPELVLRINNFRDLLITEESDFRFIFHNLEYDNKLRITASQGENSFRELKIEPHLIENKGGNQITYNSIEENQNKLLKFDTTYSEKSITELVFKFKLKEFHNTIKEYQSKLIIGDGKISFQAANNYVEKIKGVYVTPKISMASNLEKELDDLIINKREHEIIEILNIIDKNISGISFGANRMIYFDIGINRLVPINLTGDGIRRLLSLILAIYNAKNGVVLIDEIENGLHFSVLESFWKVIYKAAKIYNVQVFVTTHNIETLKYLNLAATKSDKEFQDSIRSYTIRKNNEGIYSYKYNYDKFNYSIEQGIEIR